jgi:hypothetical protein
MKDKITKIKTAFLKCSQPRSDFAIRHFVIGDHEMPERQYMQCVTELWHKTVTIKRLEISKKRKTRELQECDDDLLKEELLLDLDEISFALNGATREFNTLYAIFTRMKDFSESELQNGEADYWLHRLARQAQIDIEATGRVGAGNLDALRQIGITPDFGKMFLENPNLKIDNFDQNINYIE